MTRAHEVRAHIDAVWFTVYMYSLNGEAKSENVPTNSPVGVATTLTGLAHYDPSRTAATTQA